MKVYELMNELSKLPSGAEVTVHLLKTLDEIPEYEGDLMSIDFIVDTVGLICDDRVQLSD